MRLDGAYALVDLGSAHGTFVHRKGRSPKARPFVFYKMTKRDEVQFGASSKRFRLVADCERRRRKAERLAGRMASAPVWKSNLRCALDLHAIDATPARWRGCVGSSPLDGASTAASLVISTQVATERRARAHDPRPLAYEADEADARFRTSPTSSLP